ncbi:putative arginase [Aureobasidium pullulans]|uniref:Putative arginase n=1 Tax=Aureobasidium pullulans TaxID=5580 RepID=A0A4S8Z178_AURPU|nr:putative arginase [Aureobasidium pullulans]
MVHPDHLPPVEIDLSTYISDSEDHAPADKEKLPDTHCLTFLTRVFNNNGSAMEFWGMPSPHHLPSLSTHPSHLPLGLRDHRVGNGPHRICKLGIIKKLEGLNIDIHIEELEAVDEFEGEIGRSFELLRRTSTAVSKACAHSSFPLILSGNCMPTVGVAAGFGLEDLSFVYSDTHDDLETPSTNTNGYFDAMGMSMLKGESWHNLIATSRQKVKDMKLDVVWGDSTKKVDFSTELGNVLDARALGRTHVHLDLDVLDDTLGNVNDYPSPGGLLESDLISCMELTPEKVAPTSLTVCSFDPHAGDGDKIAKIAVHAIFTFMSSLIETGGLLRSQS